MEEREAFEVYIEACVVVEATSKEKALEAARRFLRENPNGIKFHLCAQLAEVEE